MKRAFCLTLLLLCLGVLSFALAFRTVDRSKDQITVTETSLYGDPSAVSDLTVRLPATLNNRLFWDIACPVGNLAGTSTRFSFDTPESVPGEPDYGVDLSLAVSSNCSYFSSDRSIALDDRSIPSELRGLMPVFQDVAGRTGPGETHTEEVFLRDYLSFYPLRISLSLPGFCGEWFGTDRGNAQDAVLRPFADYFSIPVRENHRIRVTVSKTSGGDITSIKSGSVDDGGLGLWSHSAVTEDACFFALSSYTSDHSPLDASHIPGGFGLYRLPFTGTEEGTRALSEALETVYPLDPTVIVEDLKVSADHTKLLLFTLEGGKHCLTVLDAHTVQVLQKLPLLDARGELLQTIYCGEDFLVLFPSQLRFGVVAEDEAGLYRLAFTGDSSRTYGLSLDATYSCTMAWDGSRLVMGFPDPQAFQPYGFSLAAYDKTGLLYIGRYDTGLTNLGNVSAVTSSWEAVFPLSLAWKSKTAGNPS